MNYVRARLVAEARGLVPLLRAQAEESARLGRLTDAHETDGMQRCVDK